jgi:hypothetical protein
MKASSRAKKILKSFPRDVQEYFAEIDETLQKQGYTLFLGGGKYLNNNGRCGGYFDDINKVLAVSMNRSLESVLSTLIHEYSHYQQKNDKNSIWHNYRIYNGHSRFFYYLDGKRIYKHKDALMGAIRLEADCERRAIKLAKKWQKYINLESYQSKANAYILSYHHMLKTGKWLKKSPYDRKIIAHSPNRLLRSYAKVPCELEKAFDRYL